jgi:integron integrase
MNRFNRSDKPDWVPPRSAKLLDQVRERVRYLHYSLQTEKAYVYWAKAFVLWVARSQGGFRHPRELGQAAVEGFLTMLATDKQVAPATHRQALNALLFLYRQVLGMELPWMQQIGSPPERKRIPVVLTVPEVQALLGQMAGTEALLYGSGLRLREALGLRVKDVDFDRHAIVVRGGKGDKDRVVMLPKALAPQLQAQLGLVRAVWGQDRAAGRGGVFLPHALERKYPRAGESWAWFWVFPSPKLSVDPQTVRA